MPYPSLLYLEPLPLWQATADLYLHRRHSNIVLSQSMGGFWVVVCTRFVWAFWAFLAGMGLDSKCDFSPPTILLRFFHCHQKWFIFSKSLLCYTATASALCSSDHELLIAKFRLKLKKVGKTTGKFSYDLNKIPYGYTVEVTNRFKGLDLMECLKNMDGGSWHCTGGSDQDHPQEKEMQKGKMVFWGGLTNSWEKKRHERQRKKEKIGSFECRVSKNSKER